MLHFRGKKTVQKENQRMLSLFSRGREKRIISHSSSFQKIVLTMSKKLGECQTFSHREWKIFVFVDSNGMSNINVALVQRNFLIGKRIEEEILTSRSEGYGKEIIKNLSDFLTKNMKKASTKLAFISTFASIASSQAFWPQWGKNLFFLGRAKGYRIS